ncbi:hypothetical protein Cni_G20658 [Canna indica]|uniref:Regulator of Vps4 activity in the MVB pathway protein n=1 Tax=Canna indica TaxID=4628 RepID=A0AAQ3QHZ0_9LILI|nr:hypothetical protein Cni_G20658 [Canna indica]
MGKKLDYLLGRTSSRNLPKLRTLLGLTISRIAVLRNHRQLRRDQAHAEVARLLQLGHVDDALLRVEQAITEQDKLDAFLMVEQYSHLLTERFMLLDHKECPEELREAVSSLVFAAPRCADELPELEKVRGFFSSKYGKGFLSASPVNAKMVQKLSTQQPTLEAKQRVAKEIAAKKGIKLEFLEPSSEISEEQPETDKNHQHYNDVATAAQAAFESASFAALAARAAVELCRSDQSQDKGSDDDENKSGSQSSSETRNSKTVDVNESGDTRSSEKKINQDQNYFGSDSDEETKAKQVDFLQKERIREKLLKQMRRSSSSSSSSSDENEGGSMVSNVQRSAVYRGKSVLFDESKSMDGSTEKHGTWYLRSSYSRGDGTINGDKKNSSLHEGTEKMELISQAQGNHVENAWPGSANKMATCSLSSRKTPMSVRTRRGV